MQAAKFAKFSDEAIVVPFKPQEGVLEIYLAQLEKPSTTNRDNIRANMSITKLGYIKGKRILESQACQAWQIEVRNDIEIILPPLIAAENTTICDTLLKHRDSMEIQAKILSMVSRHVRASGEHEFTVQLHQELLVQERRGLMGVLCRVLVCADIKTLCKDSVYVDAIWLLKYCWTQVQQEKPTQFAELLIATSLETLQNIYEAQHVRVLNQQGHDNTDADHHEHGFQKRELDIQKPILEMMGNVFEAMHSGRTSPLYKSEIHLVVRKYCSRVLRVLHLTNTQTPEPRIQLYLRAGVPMFSANSGRYTRASMVPTATIPGNTKSSRSGMKSWKPCCYSVCFENPREPRTACSCRVALMCFCRCAPVAVNSR